MYNIGIMEGKSWMIGSRDRCSKIFSIVMQVGTDVTSSNNGSGQSRSNVMDIFEQSSGSGVVDVNG